jgi:TonB family protein
VPAPPAGGDRARGDAPTATTSAPAGASVGAVRDYNRLVSVVLGKAKPKTVYESGIVEVEFRIASAGTVASVGVRKSSGSTKIDELVVAALQHTQFPAPPPDMTAEQLFYQIVYTFKPGGIRRQSR